MYSSPPHSTAALVSSQSRPQYQKYLPQSNFHTSMVHQPAVPVLLKESHFSSSSGAGSSQTNPMSHLQSGSYLQTDSSTGPVLTHLHHSSLPRKQRIDDKHGSKATTSGGAHSAPQRHLSTSKKEDTVASNLPRSVRNAPKDQRAAIRRRQNNESALRCRERKREEQQLMERQYNENQSRIDYLEKTVDEIVSVLASDTPPPKARKAGSGLSTKRRHDGDAKRKEFYGVPF